MKFGALGFSYAGFAPFARSQQELGFYTANLGDMAQTIATRELYRSLGIAERDIVVIDRDRLPLYAGEPAALLMNGVFPGHSFPIPETITPVFIGFTTAAPVVRKQRDLLRRHAPIGCRDAATMTMLREHGIDAYVSGCVTMTLPRRSQAPAAERLFIVYGARAGELPSAVLRHIPPRLLDSAVLIDHRLPVGEFPLPPDSAGWIERYERHLLNRYRDEASLVLTPLLHVSSPCLAMGVPAIIARRDRDPRFSLIGDILPVHTDRFEEIDWAPGAPGCETIARSYRQRVAQALHDIGALPQEQG